MTINFGILTVSDRSARGERDDRSGPAIIDIIEDQDWIVKLQKIVSDDKNEIKTTLTEWADGGEVDAIITTGGTGIAPRDVTPDATLVVLDRLIPGVAEAMRAESLKATPHATLSRAVAGIRGAVMIVNLPGSPKGAVENLTIILPVISHAVQLLKEDPRSEASH